MATIAFSRSDRIGTTGAVTLPDRLSVRSPSALLLVLLLVFTSQVPADDASPSAAELSDPLRRWREAFATIEVEFRYACRAQLERRFPDIELPADYLERWGSHGRLFWTDFGPFVHDSWKLENARVLRVRRKGVSRTGAFEAVGTVEDGLPFDESAVVWTELISGPTGAASYAPSSVIIPLHGLYFSQHGDWIDAALQRAPALSAPGRIEVDGHECLELVFDNPLPDGSPFYESHLCLDPGYGYLPRRVRQVAKVPGSSGEMIYEVREFQEVEPGWWFPARGIYFVSIEPDDVYDWEVTAVKRNPPVKTARLTPPTVRQNRVVASQSAGRGDEEPGSGQSAAGAAAPVAAEPPAPFPWMTLALILSLVALASGAWLYRYR